MGMIKYKRQIARGFLRDAGVWNVNKKMGAEKEGVKLWRKALQEHAKVCRKVKAKKINRRIRKAAQA